MSKKAKRGPAGGAAPERFNPKTMGKVLGCMREYRSSLVLAAVCILLSAIASAASSLFLQTLIDDHILPLLSMDTPVFTGLIRALFTIGCVYLAGVLSALIYNRVMVTIAQGTLKKIRDEMFSRMQRLPIRYFDTHTHGEVMSLYTNDTDTLRQLIAQSLSQLVSSVFTVAVVFLCMLYVSIPLTLAAVAAVFGMMKVVGGVMEKSGVYFVRQQETLADLNGYVEEMVNGQKVVKVFCHEDRAREELAARNRAWEEAAAGAGGNANAIMPMMNALGYVTLVSAKIDGDGMVTECAGHTGQWAWKHPHGDGTLTYTPLRGEITLDGVDFGYTPDKTVLHDITLRAGPGRKIAFVGATGAECVAAARLANADGFIRMLPQGYDTVLQGDGSGLSQGQRQLISIARAAVSDPPVMILDEATSSIDTRTEALVQKGMDALMNGRTVFVIAHRLSTVRNSDCILVLDHGRIIERGAHDQLIAQGGAYHQLYTGAFELE